MDWGSFVVGFAVGGSLFAVLGYIFGVLCQKLFEKKEEKPKPEPFNLMRLGLINRPLKSNQSLGCTISVWLDEDSSENDDDDDGDDDLPYEPRVPPAMFQGS